MWITTSLAKDIMAPSNIDSLFFFCLQIHVVRPVLNRIDTLIQTTVSDSQGNTRVGRLKLYFCIFFCVYLN